MPYIDGSLAGNVTVTSVVVSSCASTSWAMVSCAQNMPSLSYCDKTLASSEASDEAQF